MSKYAKCKHCNEPIELVPNSWAKVSYNAEPEYWSHCTTGYGDCGNKYHTSENYVKPLVGSESDSYDDVA